VVAGACRSTDRELLERFVQRHDQAAFEQLVRRHGNLVLGVCRRVLGNEADAEDAFQATFLLLARKASAISWQDSVAGWLHRTARQLACKARTAASRRARYEKQARARAPANPLAQLTAQEMLGILDEELLRLPERYRAPLVLCYLEGATRDEAAQLLGCPPATLKSWLERGRQRLHRAAQRRGLTLAAILGTTALLSRPMRAEGGIQAAVRAAAAVAAGRPLAGVVSAHVTQLAEGGLRTMALSKLPATLALLLVCGAFSTAALWAQRSGADAPSTPTPAAKTPPAAKAGEGKLRCQGRVLSPAGKPVPKAKVVFVRTVYNARGYLRDAPAAHGLTGSDGRFQLMVPPRAPGETGRRSTEGMLLAVAAGYGPGWVNVARAEQARDATVKLVKDGVPLVGQVVDLEGKPIKGASVRVLGLTVAQSEDLGPWLKQLRTTRSLTWPGTQFNLDVGSTALAQSVRTDALGRFRLSGFGRERLVRLRFSGPTIEIQDVWAMTRPGSTLVVANRNGLPRGGSVSFHGATFTHAAAPTRPVVGTITDKATGKPLAGITVLARPFNFERGPARSLLTRTDERGRYRLVGLPRGAGQEIQAAPDPESGYLPSGLKTGRATDLEPVRLDFKLTRGILIRGRVTDKATGKPLEVQVEYFAFADNPYLNEVPGFRGAGRNEPRTRRDGSFTLVGMPGRGIVTATVSRWHHGGKGTGYLRGVGAGAIKGTRESGDFITWPYIVTPATHNTLVGLDLARDAREVTCTLALDPGKTVKGTVVDPDGKPITGVRVRGTWGYPSSPREPLATPQFTLPAVDLGRPQPFFFTHRERKLGAVVLFKGDRTEGLTVKLKPLGVITGRVLDLDGVPLAGYLTGCVEDGQLQIKRGWAGFFWASADKDGRFRAEVIPGVGVGAYFTVGSLRLGAKVFQKLTLEPGQKHDVGDVKVNPRGD
jgi:RNA polymerase sigma factor (sigma-70 family)